MKLPIIKTAAEYIAQHDAEDVRKTIAVLEDLSQARGLKDHEVDAIGEILSNLYGALEVNELVVQGQPQREALNDFMKRVVGSIN